MNKKLVAVAVAGVLAAPLAAQAQTANVTLYGRLNLTAEVVNAQQSDGSKGNYFQVSTNSSRLGVRGTESLGGGLNAIFQIESNVSADTGSGVLGSRETFAGLQGGWGTFKIGNFLAPEDDLHPMFGNVPTLTTSLLSLPVENAIMRPLPQAGHPRARLCRPDARSPWSRESRSSAPG